MVGSFDGEGHIVLTVKHVSFPASLRTTEVLIIRGLHLNNQSLGLFASDFWVALVGWTARRVGSALVFVYDTSVVAVVILGTASETNAA